MYLNYNSLTTCAFTTKDFVTTSIPDLEETTIPKDEEELETSLDVLEI